MGLFSKVKGILFEEEEVVEPVKTVKEEEPVREEKVVERREEPVKEAVPERGVFQETKIDVDFDLGESIMGERDLFKSESNSPFQDFDEEEFATSIHQSKPKSTNVLEYERKKKVEKRTDYGRYEKTEIRETTEKKKFKPSPIISPVYGILNEDYTINDIKERKTDNNVDVDWVRKKAFEPEKIVEEEPKTTYYEESVTVKIQEPEEEKIQKGKTIDDLLEDTSDVVVDLTPSYDDKNSIEYDDIEEEVEEKYEEPEVVIENEIEEDTLENDLFDLIDSMYENREDGDY